MNIKARIVIMNRKRYKTKIGMTFTPFSLIYFTSLQKPNSAIGINRALNLKATIEEIKARIPQIKNANILNDLFFRESFGNIRPLNIKNKISKFKQNINMESFSTKASSCFWRS